jgi:16S rRNA (guanine966-N2)-methyltransferase
MLNIIGGSQKKAKLNVPIINVRPTSSKKREAIFSIIESKNLKNKSDIYSNGYFLDLFAGSGSLGLEAISRGAKYCYFYEIAKEVIQTLKSNCLKICEYNNYKIIKKDITKSFFEEIDNPLSVIFIDPPYTLAPFENILHNLLEANLILKETIIIIESEKKTKINFPYSIKIIDERYYGKTKITFLCLND